MNPLNPYTGQVSIVELADRILPGGCAFEPNLGETRDLEDVKKRTIINAHRIGWTWYPHCDSQDTGYYVSPDRKRSVIHWGDLPKLPE